MKKETIITNIEALEEDIITAIRKAATSVIEDGRYSYSEDIILTDNNTIEVEETELSNNKGICLFTVDYAFTTDYEQAKEQVEDVTVESYVDNIDYNAILETIINNVEQ